MWTERRRMAAAGLLAGALALATLACGTEEAAPGPDPTGADLLKSLPYVSSVPVSSASAPQGVVLHDRGCALPGYNLVTLASECRTLLVDNEGRVLRSWHRPGCESWSRSLLLPGGDLVVLGARGGDAKVYGIADEDHFMIRFDPGGNVRWERSFPVHHDVVPLPEGFLALTLARRSVPRIHPKIPVRDDLVTRLSADGVPGESISILDAILGSPDVFPLARVPPISWGGEVWLDLLHTNALRPRPGALPVPAGDPWRPAGSILLCSRHQDRVFIADLEARKVLWAFGAGVLSGPHDAQWLDDGNVLAFDNGLARRSSRAVVIDVPSRRISWEYPSDGQIACFSPSKGTVQRLSNDNTLIACSDEGRAFEVTPAGVKVWELYAPLQRDGRRNAIAAIQRLSEEQVRPLIGPAR